MINATTLSAVPARLESMEAAAAKAAAPIHPVHVVRYLCSAVLLLLALTVLAGWVTGSEPLMAVVPGHVRMKPNTALCFLLEAGSLALMRHQSRTGRRVGSVCALLAGLCATLSLVEYHFRINLHIDELLFRDASMSVNPGRMAMVTAVFFCVAATALLLLPGKRAARMLSQGMGVLLMTGAFGSIVGYLYGVPVLYGAAGGHNSMALHTGLGFLVLGLGLVLASPNSALVRVLCAQEAGGWLARRLVAAVILVPVFLGWLYLRPAVNFGRPRFAMAMFAVTLVVAGTLALWLLAHFINRLERQKAEIARVREQSAAAVRRSEQELRLVIDHLPTLLAYIDLDWRLVRINRTCEQWLGRASSTMLGESLQSLLGESYWERTAQARQAAERGETATFETAYPTVRGERHAQVTYAPDIEEDRLGGSARVRGFVCMVLDVEDQRIAEAALRQTEKLAVVGRLASSIAHEINNPLAAVTNLLYLAEQDTGSPWMAQAQQELGRVTQIVTQTLRFHRESTQPLPCMFCDLFESVLVLYSGRLAPVGTVVERRFRQAVPLICQEGEIRQVLANLVGNAADAMKYGGRLLLRTRPATDWTTGSLGVMLTVADTGHGIGAGVSKTLFQPFHTTKGETGSGLGLWISKEIVERHGGRLRVRSSVKPEHSGTVFSVFLPHSR